MPNRFPISLALAFALHLAAIFGLPAPKTDFRVSLAPLAIEATLIARPSEQIRAPETPIAPPGELQNTLLPEPTPAPIADPPATSPEIPPQLPEPNEPEQPQPESASPEPQPAELHSAEHSLASETTDIPLQADPAAAEEIPPETLDLSIPPDAIGPELPDGPFLRSDAADASASPPEPFAGSPQSLPNSIRETSPAPFLSSSSLPSYLDIWAQRVQEAGALMSSDAQGLVRIRVTLGADGSLMDTEILSSTNPETSQFARRVVRSIRPIGPTPTGQALSFSRVLVFEPQ